MDLVFLVHGFMRTGASMVPMALGLRRNGFTTHVVTQLNLLRDIPSLADALYGRVERTRDTIQQETGTRPDAHFVTHSMGGIVVRSLLARHEVSGPNRVVMLAPPNQGSRIAARWRDDILKLPWKGFDPLGKLLPGARGQCATAGDPDAVFGVIAGRNRGNRGDGKVFVEEARWEHASEFIVVPYGHTMIMARPRVIEQTTSFLRSGAFLPEDVAERGARAG